LIDSSFEFFGLRLDGLGEFADLERLAKQINTRFILGNTAFTKLRHLDFHNPPLVVPPGEPTDDSIASSLDSAENHTSTQNLVLVGGGATLDFGKMFSVALNSRSTLDKAFKSTAERVAIPSFHNPRILAVPTTCGSGSEVSSSAIVTVEGRKVAIVCPSFLPTATIYLPELLSKSTRSHIPGMLDIVGHSLEPMLSRTKSTYLESLSTQAIRLVMKTSGDGAGVLRPTEISNLQLAGRMAGKVQNSSSVGLPHALAHTYPTAPHGLLVGHYNVQLLRELRHMRHPYFSYLTSLLGGWEIDLDSLIAWCEDVISADCEYRNIIFQTLDLDQDVRKSLLAHSFVRASMIDDYDKVFDVAKFTMPVEGAVA
jgi:alcohol dehydrogenase class IV